MSDSDEILEDYDCLEDVLDELLDRNEDRRECQLCYEEIVGDDEHHCMAGEK